MRADRPSLSFGSMEFTPIGEMDLTYEPGNVLVDYGSGGQYYGVMVGTWRGGPVSGSLRMTNVAHKRPDNVNTPTLRGILETEDGATMFVEMNGLSQIEGGGRVFVAALTLRTGHPGYAWVNTLLAVVEGELHGRPKAGEVRAQCRVFACRPTISPDLARGHESMRATASAIALTPAGEATLEDIAREVRSETSPYAQVRRQAAVTREAAYRQRLDGTNRLILYRELSSSSEPGIDSWLRERLGTDAGAKVELLVRQRQSLGSLHAQVLRLPPDRATRLHEWALELNGIHADELEQSLRRLAHGLTLFVQHEAEGDLAILLVEGDDPRGALSSLAASEDAFDRWFTRQLADICGADISVQPASEILWDWNPAERAGPQS